MKEELRDEYHDAQELNEVINEIVEKSDSTDKIRSAGRVLSNWITNLKPYVAHGYDRAHEDHYAYFYVQLMKANARAVQAIEEYYDLG